MMRTYIAVLVIAALSTCLASAQSVEKVFTAKSFSTTVNRTDTSGMINLLFSPYVELATNTAGTDSLKLVIAVDYQVAGRWINGGVRDTVKFGPATSANKAKGTIVLAPYTASAIPGAQYVRIRNTLIPFRTADSTSATSYTQTLTRRKN